MLRRKPKWEVTVRSLRAVTRPIRVRITKRDRVEVVRPPGRTTVVVYRPSKRLAKVHALDLLEVRYRGHLISALPIRTVTYEAGDRRLSFMAEPRGF